jgi:hypothetical protein
VAASLSLLVRRLQADEAIDWVTILAEDTGDQSIDWAMERPRVGVIASSRSGP